MLTKTKQALLTSVSTSLSIGSSGIRGRYRFMFPPFACLLVALVYARITDFRSHPFVCLLIALGLREPVSHVSKHDSRELYLRRHKKREDAGRWAQTVQRPNTHPRAETRARGKTFGAGDSCARTKLQRRSRPQMDDTSIYLVAGG